MDMPQDFFAISFFLQLLKYSDKNNGSIFFLGVITNKSPPIIILSSGTTAELLMSVGVSPDNGIIISPDFDNFGFDKIVLVLLIIVSMYPKYLVYNSPYKIHLFPSGDRSSFDNPLPFDNDAIWLNVPQFKLLFLNLSNLNFGTLLFLFED